MDLEEIKLPNKKIMPCSKLWTDLIIKFPTNIVTHCCKQIKDYEIPASDINNPNFFINSAEILKDKKTFALENKFPKSCSYCSSAHPHSLYTQWNKWINSSWSAQELELLLEKNYVNHIELRLSSICNQTCMYCNERWSTSWAKLKKVKTQKGSTIWKSKVKENLWKFLENSSVPTEFNFVGGEPFLAPDLFDVLYELEKIYRYKNLSKKSTINITTNANFTKKILDKFFAHVENNKDVFDFSISISIDTVDEKNIEIREGIDNKRYYDNISKMLHNKNIKRIVFGPTINLLNISRLPELFSFFIEKSIQVNRTDPSNIGISYNIVADPIAMSPMLLPKNYCQYLDQTTDVIKTYDLKKLNVDRFFEYLDLIKNLIGTKRTVKNLEIAKDWYTDQGVLKNKNYYDIFPEVNTILDVKDVAL